MSKWPAWKVIRWLLIASGLLAIPRAALDGNGFQSLDVVEFMAWVWNGGLVPLVDWVGIKTGAW